MPDDFAASQAEPGPSGLAGWGLDRTDIGALRDEDRLHDLHARLPGRRGRSNIVGSLQAPADMTDTEIVGDEIEGYVTGLLGLVGIDADPLSSREHILLSNLIHELVERGSRRSTCPRSSAWSRHRRSASSACSSSTSSSRRRTAPRSRCGSTACSRRRRSRRGRWARRSTSSRCCSRPTAAAAARSSPPRTSSDEERQFVTTLVLSKLVTWMRRQSGTTDLRAMLYMDEVAGYLPPTAMPPTKKPIMTLMKQARAFGVGVVLSHAEPGRHRLQGDVERRHLDDRSPADRPRQAAPARRHERRPRAASTSARSATPSAASASVSSSCAAPARTSPRCSPPAGR